MLPGGCGVVPLVVVGSDVVFGDEVAVGGAVAKRERPNLCLIFHKYLRLIAMWSASVLMRNI